MSPANCPRVARGGWQGRPAGGRHVAAICRSARASNPRRSHLPDLQIPPYVRQRRDCQQPEGRGGGRHGYCSDVSECSHRVPPVLQLIGVSGPAPESPGRGGDSSIRARGQRPAGVASGRLPAGAGPLALLAGRPRPGLACAESLTPAPGGSCGRAQRRRSIMTTSTIRTVVPGSSGSSGSRPPSAADFRCYPQATLESQN